MPVSTGSSRREFLRASGVIAAASIAGCLRGDAESMQQRILEKSPVDIDPTVEASSGTSEEPLTRLNVDTEEFLPADALQTTANDIVLCGQFSDRPYVLKLTAAGSVAWIRVLRSLDGSGSFTSIIEAPDGSLVAVGWHEWSGLVAQLDPSGEIQSRRTVSLGPQRGIFQEVLHNERDGFVAVGYRKPGKNGDGPSSAWLAGLTNEMTVDWHRFYGTNVWSVREVAIVGQSSYLLVVWKQTPVGLNDYDAVVAIRKGLQRWEHPYPPARINGIGAVDTDQYYVSAAGGTVSDVTVPPSVAFGGVRRLADDLSWLTTISFTGTELTGGLSLPLSDGLRLVCNTAESVPVTATIGWDGSVRDGGAFTDAPVWRFLPVSEETVVAITESAELRTISFGVNQ